jgi:N-acetylglucosaminyl-diphospho-decaprenol L-rhamnosyltransferase
MVLPWYSSGMTEVAQHSGEVAQRPDITVIVVNYNTAHLLDRMFSALGAARSNLTIQTIVIDNASSDGSSAKVRQSYPDVELIENRHNVGFGRANNQALPRIRGRYALLLNTDSFVAPETLRQTITYMDEHHRCGVLGVKLVAEDGTLQPSCRYFPTPWNTFLLSTGLARYFPRTRLVDDMTWDPEAECACDWVPGCYYLIRPEVIDHLGLFDPRYFLYYEEVDHCRRVRAAGWDVIYYPFTKVVHIGGESAKALGSLSSGSRQVSALQIESELLYFRKHHGFFGLLSAVCLSTFTDLILILKNIGSASTRLKASAAQQHMRTVLGLLAKTRLASQATR